MSAPLINAKSVDYKEPSQHPFDTAQVAALLYLSHLRMKKLSLRVIHNIARCEF
jgi:hypothetical protein